MFYNSLFFNGNAVAKLDLIYSPSDVSRRKHAAAEREHQSTRARARRPTPTMSPLC